jgi:hypothetical protein
MSKSAEGIVEKAATFTAKVRPIRDIKIQVYNLLGLQTSEPFKVQVGDEIFEGKTSDKGVSEVTVPRSATEATLYVGDNVYDLKLVADEPTDSIEWTQTRLNNLGFDCGTIDGEWGPQSKAAMKSFQQINGLEATGIRDKKSLDLLEKIHDHEYESAEHPKYDPESDESDDFPEEDTSSETGEEGEAGA